MKAVFIKDDVVIGVAMFSAGSVKSSDPAVSVQYVEDDVDVQAGYVLTDGVFSAPSQ